MIVLSLIWVLGPWAYVVTFIHELGHLFFGLLTGYEFCYIHVGGKVLFKKDGKLKLERSIRRAPAGSCRMVTKRNEENFKFVLYYLGGVLFTSVLTVGCLLVAVFVKEKSVYIFFSIATGYGLLRVLFNLIPLGINDGRMIKDASKSREARHCLYVINVASRKLKNGERYKDFEKQMFVVDKEADYTNCFVAAMVFEEAIRLYDSGDIDIYMEQYKRVDLTKNSLYRTEIIIEHLYYYIVQKPDEYKAKLIYSNKDVQRALKNEMWNYARVAAAYEIVINRDYEQGQKYLDVARESAEKLRLKGETLMELDRIEELEERLAEITRQRERDVVDKSAK